MQVFLLGAVLNTAAPTILDTLVSVSACPGVELMGCRVCVHLYVMSDIECPWVASVAGMTTEKALLPLPLLQPHT